MPPRLNERRASKMYEKERFVRRILSNLYFCLDLNNLQKFSQNTAATALFPRLFSFPRQNDIILAKILAIRQRLENSKILAD